MRQLNYITVGKILNELALEGLPITRMTFYRLETRLSLPAPKRTTGKLRWRVYQPAEAEEVKKKIREEYGHVAP